MAKTATCKVGSVKRQGRRVMPAPRRATQRKASPALTVGELIAAAYDTAGGESGEVIKLVTSP